MKRFIEKSYGIEMTGISPLPRGFYGEVYRVDIAERSYAAKLDRWRTHSAEFRESLEAVELICESGIDFVPALIRGANGERCFSYDGGVLALFEFTEGVHTEDVPAEALFERLGRVYSRVPAAQKSAEELFTPEAYERVLCLRKHLKAAGELRPDAVLAKYSGIIGDRVAKLKLFMERCRVKKWRTVMTHGDAGGNCILGKNGISLIDWDTAKISVPERDAWAHMAGSGALGRIEAGLAAGGYEYRPDSDAMGFFANSWFFEYIGNYLQCAADKPECSGEMADMLDDYFGCWIFDVLKRADELI